MKTMPLKILDVLRKPEHWLKHRLASCRLATDQEPTGGLVLATDPCAVSFCLVGAAIRCYRGSGGALDEALQAIYNAMPEQYRHEGVTGCVVQFNNAPETKFSDIRRVLRAANV